MIACLGRCRFRPLDGDSVCFIFAVLFRTAKNAWYLIAVLVRVYLFDSYYRCCQPTLDRVSIEVPASIVLPVDAGID